MAGRLLQVAERALSTPAVRGLATAAAESKPDLNAFWMPFTNNRQFKSAPRMFVGAKDMHYVTADGRQVLDGTAGTTATFVCST